MVFIEHSSLLTWTYFVGMIKNTTDNFGLSLKVLQENSFQILTSVW